MNYYIFQYQYSYTQKALYHQAITNLIEALENNEKILFKGFLSFDTKLVKDKNGNSFGKDWSIPSKYVPKVKFSTAFKKMLALNTKVT